MGTAYDSSTLWLFNTAMENGPFIDGLPTKNCGSFHGYVKKPDGICKWLAAQGMAGCVLWFCVSEFSVRPQMTDRLWLQNLVSTKRQKSNWPCLYTYIYIYSRNQSSLGCANDFEPCPISFSSYTCWEICTAYNWLSSLVGTVQTLVFLINMMFESNSWGEFPFRIYCLR